MECESSSHGNCHSDGCCRYEVTGYPEVIRQPVEKSMKKVTESPISSEVTVFIYDPWTSCGVRFGQKAQYLAWLTREKETWTSYGDRAARVGDGDQTPFTPLPLLTD